MLNQKLATVSSYLCKFDFVQIRFYSLKKIIKVDKIGGKLYRHESDKHKKCLSVGNFGILSVVIVACLSVAHLQPTSVYIEACNIY